MEYPLATQSEFGLSATSSHLFHDSVVGGTCGLHVASRHGSVHSTNKAPKVFLLTSGFTSHRSFSSAGSRRAQTITAIHR